MGFQVQEVPMKFSGVTYGVAGIAAAILIIIASLARCRNVSKMNKITHSAAEFWFASLARRIPYGWLQWLVWLLVGWFQIFNQCCRCYTRGIREGKSILRTHSRMP